jgi:hypothetical protein
MSREQHTPPTTIGEQAPASALDRIEAQARQLLDDPLLGALVRQSSNAVACGRRQRVHSHYVVCRVVARHPQLAPFFVEAIALAWAQKLAELVPHPHGVDDEVRSVDDLLKLVVTEERP